MSSDWTAEQWQQAGWWRNDEFQVARRERRAAERAARAAALMQQQHAQGQPQRAQGQQQDGRAQPVPDSTVQPFVMMHGPLDDAAKHELNTIVQDYQPNNAEWLLRATSFMSRYNARAADTTQPVVVVSAATQLEWARRILHESLIVGIADDAAGLGPHDPEL